MVCSELTEALHELYERVNSERREKSKRMKVKFDSFEKKMLEQRLKTAKA